MLLKALHISFVVCWFAGLFYLPRLFVYHAQCEDTPGKERFKIMERKLYWGIMTPSALLAAGLGSWMLILSPALLQQGWLHAKFACVLALVVYLLACGHYLKQFARDANQRSHVFYRWFNEVPVIFLFAIVILAVTKPF